MHARVLLLVSAQFKWQADCTAELLSLLSAPVQALSSPEPCEQPADRPNGSTPRRHCARLIARALPSLLHQQARVSPTLPA